MLHILLTILKIIGIILLVIIGLVLLICSCILFVPIRYSARVKYNETPDICVRVTYLLRLISIKYALIGKDKKISIKLFGIDISKFKRNKNRNRKKKSKEKKSKENDLLEEEASIDIFEEVAEKRYIDKADEDLRKAAKENMKVKDDDIETVEEEFSKSTEESSDKNRKTTLYEKIRNKIISVKNKFIYRFKSICGKIKKAISKFKDFKEFVQDKHTKAAFKLIKDELIKLLKYIKPRKIKGYLNFGFEDPSMTGKVLGVYYAIMKGCPKKFNLNPDFENKRLEADVFLKGRIRLYYVIYIVLRIYLNQDFKYVLKHNK